MQHNGSRGCQYESDCPGPRGTDWGRVKEHVRHGWRNAEVLAPAESELPSKWHLRVRKADGEVAHLDVYKGAGITESVITYEAAASVGLPRGHAYLIQVKGVRTDSDFRAKGVDVIRRAAVRRNDCGELPLGQRPDVLLGNFRPFTVIFKKWRRQVWFFNSMD